MLDRLRQGAQGWVAKALMTVLLIAFAVWGIGGFQGYHTGTLARVGGQEVSLQEFGRVYENAQRAAQQQGQQVNPQQVLSTLLLNAALDDAAQKYGLGVSNERVADEIAKNPAFQNNGAFDHDRFTALLQNAGIRPDDFVRDVKDQLVREQIGASLSAGLTVPQPLVAALYRLQNETRTVSFITVDDKAIQPVGAPTDAELQSYFDANKAKFSAPELRKLGLLTVDPQAIADPASVSEDDVKAEYDRRKPGLVQPERRRVEEITFPSADAANAALAKMQSGQDFATVAQQSGATVTDLGVKTKAEMLDPAVADAAFKAELNKPVAAIEGALQPTVLQVTSIEPEKAPTLEEETPDIRKSLAVRNARDHVQDLFDQIEDERAGGATLEETAAKLSLPYQAIDAVAADMTDGNGNPVTVPGGQDVVKGAFESDVGNENDPIQTKTGGWIFYDVLAVDPARDRTLDEVRDKVVAAWTTEETGKRIAALADKLFDQLKGGAALADVAAGIGKTVSTDQDVKRSGTAPGLTTNAVSQAFAGPEGHVANADGDGQARILLKVDQVVAPAFFAEAADAKAIKEQLSGALEKDLLSVYNQQLLADAGSSVNNAAYAQVAGQSQSQ
jgi:peptidyl-prolyl cis-trans isomerase D